MNARQKKFAQFYLEDPNATKAAARAGYSEKAAKEKGYQLLQNKEVQQYLHKKRALIEERSDITAQKVIEELAKIGFSNVQDYINSGNEIQDLSQITSEKAAAVSSIKKSITHFGSEKTEGTKEVVEFKLWDKTDALEKLGKHLGIFEKDNAQKKQDIVIKKNVIKLANGDEISI